MPDCGAHSGSLGADIFMDAHARLLSLVFLIEFAARNPDRQVRMPLGVQHLGVHPLGVQGLGVHPMGLHPPGVACTWGRRVGGVACPAAARLVVIASSPLGRW